MPSETSDRNRTGPESTRQVTSTGRAPGRVNLIGEHVDYNGGRCLPIALRESTSATVRLRADDRLVFTSDQRRWEGSVAGLGAVRDWAAYVGGVLLALEVERGMDIDIDSEVPVGAGLSSSAALECSVAVAVDAALGLGLSRDEIEQACVRAESEFVGAPTGGMDQAIAMHAREGHALLIDFGTGDREQVPFAPAAHGLTLLVIDTGVSHALTDGSYGARREECDEAARRLGVTQLVQATGIETLPEPLDRRVRHVLSEVARVDACVELLRGDDWARLGPVLNASHASLRDDFEVSSPELDVVVDTALQAGALGARMTGGGFGGSAIALVPVERADAVRAAISTAFAAHGWQRPAFLTADPGPGASVESA